jgi:hypothetical protein
MASKGLPTGGMNPSQRPSVNGQYFPSRSELSADLSGSVSPFGYDPLWSIKKFLGANKGYTKYDQLAAGYGDNEAVAEALGLGSRVAGTYYAGDEQVAEEVGEYSPTPVSITQIPTSSTNYSRPRTVAAGYDEARETMTVVFRDGTFYNYYQVSPTEWESFSASFSKGRPWLNKANETTQAADGIFISKPRGVADVSTLDPGVKEQLYRVASAYQIAKKPRAHKTAYNPRKLDPTGGKRVSSYRKNLRNK